ncbi:MAG: hypothetical protein CMK49_02135 [Prochlorococcus sp. SP3034]|nr:hypothetical protein [Prochlorococcus sp. SP3034]|tara:strand:- start:78 stop:335 length:258 start_codon:yes stop_codon:yes gene_type:complete
MKRQIVFVTFLISIVLPIPAHAYAGPGVAIATILIFATVLLSFFASLGLKIFKITKKFFKSFTYLIKKNFFTKKSQISLKKRNKK